MLPKKTFLITDCPLYDSNFDTSGTVRLQRIMDFMQDAAGRHAQKLGFGWDNLDSTGCLWVLSKLKLRFDRPVTRQTEGFTLCTWPLRPQRFFAERCFEASDANGNRLFCATSVWLIIDRNSRKIVSSDRLNDIYNCDFDDAHSDISADFERIRRTDDYALCYERTVRRSDLDVNGHVNNTVYANLAVDVLSPDERVREVQIVYQKELRLGDTVRIFSRRADDAVYVVGERDETCFSALLTLDV